MDFNAMRDDYRFSQEHVDDIKSRYRISAIIGESTRLIGRNGQYMASCPFHVDRKPSLSINDKVGLFHCFSCQAGGDVINYIQQREGIGFADACSRLENGYVPQPFERQFKQDVDDEGARAARSLWNSCGSLSETPAERYLDQRAIPFEFAMQQENLRYARLSFDGSSVQHHALVAAARNVHGEIVAVQKTFLSSAGFKLCDKCKRNKGPITGAAVRVCGLNAPSEVPEHIYVCEGLEDGLSIARIFDDAVVWVTLGTTNLPAVELPDTVRRVTIALDNDGPGRRAGQLAAERLIKAGKEVLYLIPDDPFKDWNEYHAHYEFSSDIAAFKLPYRRYVSDEEANDPEWEGPYLPPEPPAAVPVDDLNCLENS